MPVKWQQEVSRMRKILMCTGSSIVKLQAEIELISRMAEEVALGLEKCFDYGNMYRIRVSTQVV